MKKRPDDSTEKPLPNFNIFIILLARTSKRTNKGTGGHATQMLQAVDKILLAQTTSTQLPNAIFPEDASPNPMAPPASKSKKPRIGKGWTPQELNHFVPLGSNRLGLPQENLAPSQESNRLMPPQESNHLASLPGGLVARYLIQHMDLLYLRKSQTAWHLSEEVHGSALKEEILTEKGTEGALLLQIFTWEQVIIWVIEDIVRGVMGEDIRTITRTVVWGIVDITKNEIDIAGVKIMYTGKPCQGPIGN
ncbi:hypothetical protein F5876DRAFT_69025 [Lentinula aff. lateritia]|uniref:Uncharacterized protein n=1 Tax=Lentinula aff. lateritia TaxID=2804960 RepID=A0ACC1TNZ9_9AGAR|nr:hypothetical protein F5876DRAFT_69025 [Lentinula aff. lateritia]